MRRRVMLGVALVVVSAVASGGGGAGAAAPPEVAAYFPLVPGTVWVYRSGDGAEVLRRVGGVVKAGAQECRLIETVAGGGVTQSECFRVTAGGVYVVQRSGPGGSVALTPPQPLLSAPPTVGRTWQWTSTIGDRNVTFDYQWARRETVVTPAGRFDALQSYLSAEPAPGARIQSWRWFARGVGMIKEDTVVTQGSQQQRGYLELLRVTKGR